MDNQFSEIVRYIHQAKQSAYQAVNAELVSLYWKIGKYVHQKVAANDWGKSIIVELAQFIHQNEPGIQGFSDRNIWRMKQFYETYSNAGFLKLSALPTVLKTNDIQEDTILSAVLRELNWTSHLEIISSCKDNEERLFYLIKAKSEKWSYRELKRQIASSLFERTMIGNAKEFSSSEISPDNTSTIFKDSYVLEFLNLPIEHNENDLKNAIVSNLKEFILEFGRDFAFMGQEYRVQVGNQDFFIDLLFYHRRLQCLVAVELKTVKFAPEHLAQINFYLEALDRDIKNEYENPSMGILLCKGKDDVVVEYALSRTLKPAAIANYQLALPNKKILQQKWQEILELNEKKEE